MPPASLGLSDCIATHIAETPYGALPQAARDAACRALLDATGVMLGASGLSPDVQPFVDLARTSGTGPCNILGTGATATAPMAAFANGAMAHALDYEDAFDPAPNHPNAALMPAAIALTQMQGGVDGKTFITALAIGCDLVCRMGLSLRQTMEESGWYPPPILGAFGATAAAARILGLDAVQTRDALSLVLCQAIAPGEIKHSRDTVIRAVREAFPAQAAVQSALLAKDGVRGFEQPLEGKGGFFRLFVDGHYDETVLRDGLGEYFHGERLSFKPWPACRGTHSYIELALALKAEHGFAWQDIERVEADTGEVQQMLVEPLDRKQAPATAIDAKFSIPFTLATALVKDRVTLDDFSQAALEDRDTLAVAALVNPLPRAEWGRDMASAAAISITLKDGRTLSAEAEIALGHPDRPLSREQLVLKFIDCAGRAKQPPKDVIGVADELLNIEKTCDVSATFGKM